MKIVDKKILCDTGDVRVIKMEISALEMSKKIKPGQFVVLMVSENGERIPLTMVEKDEEKGTVTVIFQEVGLTTKLLGKMEEGDSLFSFIGPLGHETVIKNYGTVVLVGGGVGIAEIYPIARAFKEAENYVISIIGSKSKSLLILERELQEVSDEIYVTTDDGSYGKKGFTTDVLKGLLDKNISNRRIDLIFAVGPVPMMKNVVHTAKDTATKVVVSLNTLMVDATGMCGCCRITVGTKTKFACIDGPEFDGELVDWDELMKRNSAYLEKENHICKLILR